MKIGLSLVAVTAGALLASAAMLIAGETFTSRGNGTFTIDGERSTIAEGSFTLRDKGRYRCEITLDDGTTLEMTGKIQGDGMHRNITLRHGLGRDDIEGHGEVTLGDHEATLREFTAYGKVDGKHFAINYKSSRDDWHDHDGGHRHERGFSYSNKVYGTGRIDVGDVKSRITLIDLQMSRNGDLTLHAEGPEMPDTVWRGRWEGEGPEFRIDLRDAQWFDVRAKGTLTMSHNSSRVKSIEVEGKQDGEFFRLYFQPE